jgi:hypothetical protein
MKKRIRFLGGLILPLVLLSIVGLVATVSRTPQLSSTAGAPASATRSLGPFELLSATATDGVAPTVPQAAALSTATRALLPDPTHFTAYQLTDAEFVPGLTEVTDAVNKVWYKTTLPEDDWVMFFVAPGQSGWKFVDGLVVVNAVTGVIESYQVRYSNIAADAVPGA